MDYRAKHVVVTGGASGVGAALLELLAELGCRQVTVLDLNTPAGPHSRFIQTNLADPCALDAAIDQIDAPVDVLFNNAGIADTAPRDRVIAASVAGMSWAKRLGEIQELLALDSRAAMVAWLDGRELGVDTYSFTKEALIVWTMRSASALVARGIRINSVCPNPIDTPLLADFRQTIGEAGLNFAMDRAGGVVSPRQVAQLLAFFGSDLAAMVSGQNIDIDYGFRASIVTGTVDTSAVRASAGR